MATKRRRPELKSAAACLYIAFVPKRQRADWVRAATREHKTLSNWVVEKLNTAAEIADPAQDDAAGWHCIQLQLATEILELRQACEARLEADAAMSAATDIDALAESSPRQKSAIKAAQKKILAAQFLMRAVLAKTTDSN